MILSIVRLFVQELEKVSNLGKWKAEETIQENKLEWSTNQEGSLQR